MISVKSQSEIDIMRKAGEITALVLERIEALASPGITTMELDRVAAGIIASKGAIASFKGYKGLRGAPDYPASICASVNEEVVHGIPGQRILKDGDIVSIDVGVYFEGFHSDAARTYAIGNVSDKARQLMDAAKKSFFLGIKNAVPGMRVSDISGAIQDYVESKGFAAVRDYVGHGIGREMHEAPQIPNYRAKERGPRLDAGMTIAVEPMINEGCYEVRLMENKWTVVTADGKLSAHYENTIAVRHGEPLILTVL